MPTDRRRRVPVRYTRGLGQFDIVEDGQEEWIEKPAVDPKLLALEEAEKALLRDFSLGEYEHTPFGPDDDIDESFVEEMEAFRDSDAIDAWASARRHD
ncbi:hypothetical protein ABIA16_001762 [Sinorhizobium fredii]